MCGISGKVYFDRNQVTPRQLQLMSLKLSHRGPDGTGYFISKNKQVGFAHNRLSIIDLTIKGRQPMVYKERYVITFNGEIYNFKEEKAKLIKKGYTFQSNTDTEVVVALYSEYGKALLDHLRGMFAFAIYDIKEEQLLLARDRIGKKPLKYYLDQNTLIFASELKAILTQREVKRAIDYKAIQLYLTYGYIPAPQTGFQKIRKLEPGSYLLFNLKTKKIEHRRYWQPTFDQKLQLSEREWCNKILQTLSEATKMRMYADVPLGAFLSGGIDSSSIVALMSTFSKKPVKTFTITFEDKDLNEGPFALNIARKYHTDHHELLAKPQSVEILPSLAHQYEEPFADSSTVVTWMISQLARKHIKVVLTGDGGDENFAGYPNRYLRLKRDVDYNRWIQYIRPFTVEILKGYCQITDNLQAVRIKKFFEKSRLPIYERFASYNQIFKPEEILLNASGELSQVNKKYDPHHIIESCFNLFEGKDLKDAGLKFDLLFFLPDDLLVKMDIATMAMGLEARSPFLDQELVELACKIPFNLKVRNGETKYILKKALLDIIPRENLYRPKVGFTIPLGKWFKQELHQYASHLLLTKGSKTRHILKYSYVKQMVESNNQKQDFGPRLWALMFLELWIREYFG